jgi:hypothetical protein
VRHINPFDTVKELLPIKRQREKTRRPADLDVRGGLLPITDG